MGERATMITEAVLARIEALQHELQELHKAVARQARESKRPTKLRGLWKGVRVSDRDFAEAKRAIFRQAYGYQD